MPKITFANWGVTVEVKPGTSILDAAEQAEAQGVKMGHVCGGVCACSTCHCYVKVGFDSLEEASDREEDILDKAFDVKPMSRLGCQAEVGNKDLVVEVSEESLQAWYDEHPEERRAAEARGER
ncbi:2Fe-2S iron-sulfur cluster-binding protein [Vulgatibacter incomptus]|uniref:Ferredoxin, 2Fe-2S n=1 Tax=Vulgatibacter incomptus TaxID=1391653 RepID=A0A0K1PED3_9BACT|nr:2Fe-2S iron-sulfur cluster-binding protein [Vulgatibacter incomptus]AKU91898.1 Ferredoxin, 2Fe-2S [Vulgatibacter incomptus]